MTTFSANALEGRVALVTGTSRGIGAAILEAFVKAGATVVGTATSEAGAERITARIAELGGKGRGPPPRPWSTRSPNSAASTFSSTTLASPATRS